jgi:hypothetical protein
MAWGENILPKLVQTIDEDQKANVMVEYAGQNVT